MNFTHRFLSLFLFLFSTLYFVPWSVQATVSLPENLKWETNYDDPSLGDPNAKKGGTFRTYMLSYPSTFRIVGAGSRGIFAYYASSYALFPLTAIHPTTFRSIPILATHWAIMDDNRTVYYKLNKKARWSDGEPITADDFVFAGEVFASKWIQDPFMNNLMEDKIESIEKIDDYTLKVVSRKASWRVLYEQNLYPIAKHATQLDKRFLRKYQWKFDVVPGPYIIKRYRRGKWVQFSRIKNWWGEDEHYFKGLYNFDKIRFKVIRNQDVAFELFKRGKLDFYRVTSSSMWARNSEFEAVQKGYVNKQLVYNQSPSGAYGVWMNTEAPHLSDIRIRKAIAHLFDFNIINEKMMFGAYSRKHLFFDTLPPYRHPTLKTREFDISKAGKLLEEAGWKEFNNKGIRMKNGRPLRLVMNYGGKSITRLLTVFKESAMKAGIDIQLKAMDRATSWKTNQQKKHQLTMFAMTSGLYPSPREYLHSSQKQPNANNFFMIDNKEVDRLITVYENSENETERVNAIRKMDEFVHNQALWIPFFNGDYIRLLWWRHIQTPKWVIHKSEVGSPLTSALLKEWDTWWNLPEEKERMEKAKKEEKSFKRLPIEYDPYDVNPNF